ncbi:pyrroline-5-carboxylate reductase [Mariprofundus ferrooxydans]|uniref:Pyrroline-5-carboxylate reductase n=1 Tax=Mariprofundus ferrooxydans PV-1 TaxID=314345 RepID=Q0EXW9_9PROT|nr:pyrroline-5-carboxylate reductase [Mariprofundus ferrooxydans]EAU54083.1 pyrroline-5-carboxylate reductase [Mariprofundus ferrooxydans PV-1]KON48886.1 pyrroline-5-carboxylate reductase [Mariprofundus ferrooxydans]
MQQLTISFIGGGNMAEALIAGLRRAGHAAELICVAEPTEARRQQLSSIYGVRTTADNVEAVSCADMLVLAVKPQQMKNALSGMGEHLKTDATIVSIAAGVSISSLAEWLSGKSANLVRVMPNTPALVGEGMSVLYSDAGDEHHNRATYLMQACGAVEWVDSEQQMHAVTAVSGSGPAYFFLLAEVMRASGVALGLSEELAGKLAAQTALGAGRMLAESGRTPEILRQQVTSPGGTTQAALDVMFEEGLPATVRKALAAASKRSKELAG